MASTEAGTSPPKIFYILAASDVDRIATHAASWSAFGQRRMQLERWLAGERHDEADRTVKAKPTKGKAASRRTLKAVVENGNPH